MIYLKFLFLLKVKKLGWKYNIRNKHIRLYKPNTGYQIYLKNKFFIQLKEYNKDFIFGGKYD